MIDDAISAAKREQLVALSSECQLPLDELDVAVRPIIDSCTKEAISVCTFLRSFDVSKLHTHTHPLTTLTKGKTNLDFTGARQETVRTTLCPGLPR